MQAFGIVWSNEAKPPVFETDASLFLAAPGLHPAEARRIAANIAKLPELLRK